MLERLKVYKRKSFKLRLRESSGLYRITALVGCGLFCFTTFKFR